MVGRRKNFHKRGRSAACVIEREIASVEAKIKRLQWKVNGDVITRVARKRGGG